MIGVPAYRQFIDYTRTITLSTDVFRTLNIARSESLYRGRPITICGSSNGMDCSRSDITELITFIDDNLNRKLDSDELALHYTSLPTMSGTLTLRASLKRSYIVFNHDGSARQAGSFVYCPNSGKSHLMRKVTLSLSGRSYIARTSSASSAKALTTLCQ